MKLNKATKSKGRLRARLQKPGKGEASVSPVPTAAAATTVDARDVIFACNDRRQKQGVRT